MDETDQLLELPKEEQKKHYKPFDDLYERFGLKRPSEEERMETRLMWRDSAKCYMERHKLMLEENNTQEGFVYHQ